MVEIHNFIDKREDDLETRLSEKTILVFTKFKDRFKSFQDAVHEHADQMFHIDDHTPAAYLAGCWACAKDVMNSATPLDRRCWVCKKTVEEAREGDHLERNKIRLVITGHFIGAYSDTGFKLSRDLKYFDKIYAPVVLYTSVRPQVVERELAIYNHAEDEHAKRRLTRIEDYFYEVVYEPGVPRIAQLIKKICG